MHVLSNMIASVKPGGLVFDLQVIPPNPIVEAGDEILCEIDGEPLLRQAAAAAAAVDDLIARGSLLEQARDDHDVRTHYRTGADLVDDFADSERTIPEVALPRLLALQQACVVRERCRLRRLRTVN